MDILNDLFVCDLANNHFGDTDHALQIVEEIAKIRQDLKNNVAIKFQFRNLETYIHKSYRDRDDLKYIKRFQETKLSKSDFVAINSRIKEHGIVSMATAFDEDSIKMCQELDIDVLKVASASANDFSLISKLTKLGKPMIVSTGGLRQDEIDKIVFKFADKVPDFGLMHCVSIYPTEDSDLNLLQIATFRARYAGIRIGWSTHENPKNFFPVAIATTLGATIYERHVGIESSKYKLNDYSSNPELLKQWMETQLATREMMGNQERSPAKIQEAQTLSSLKRGLYVNRVCKAGDLIEQRDVYPAFPLQTDLEQYFSGEIEFPLVAKLDIEADGAITAHNTQISAAIENVTDQIVLQVRGVLAKAQVEFNKDAEIELSHHYGLERFREFGAVLITCVNEEYAKKIIVQLPRQKHPYHYHEKKKESFQLLWGDMEIFIEGKSIPMHLGQIITVEQGKWHKFSTLHGAVVEEISTTALQNDSFYDDPLISKMDRSSRKTKIKNWNVDEH